MRRKAAPVRQCKVDTETGSVSGYGAVFHNIDLGQDKILPGAFSRTLRSKRKVPMLWHHKDDQPIGLFISNLFIKYDMWYLFELNDNF